MSSNSFKIDNSLVLRPKVEPVSPEDGEFYYDRDLEIFKARSRNSWISFDNVSLSFSVNQANSFVLHDAVYWSGSSWQLAKADNENTLATHIVNYISSADPNVFELCSIGRMNYGTGFDIGKSVGQYYFLSDRYGANFVIKDNPLSVGISINGINYTITGTTVATKLANLISVINSAGYRASGYGDVVAIESMTSIPISSVDNEIISVSASSTRLGFATPFKPSFGYDNLLFFAESKTVIVYNCYRPIALGGISSSSSDDFTKDGRTIFSQNFNDAKLTDFIQTGLVLENTSPIYGEINALLVHQPATTQSFKKSMSIDRAFRGKRTRFLSLIQSTASDATLTLTLKDETNSVNILSSYALPFFSITATNLSITAGLPTISGFAYPEPLNSLVVGCRVTGPGIPPGTFIQSINTGTYTATMSNNATLTSATSSLKFSDLSKFEIVDVNIPINCESLSYEITAQADADYSESRIGAIILEPVSITNLESQIYLPNLSSWQPYPATTQGFGTLSSSDFRWRQVGENIEIMGNFVVGTPTANEAQIGLPLSYITASASVIPSLMIVGSGSQSDFQMVAEPNVPYISFADYSSTSGLLKKDGDEIVSAGDTISFFASVPCDGLTATSLVSIESKEIENQILIAATDINFDEGRLFTKTISANTNFTFSNTGNGQVRVIVINNSSASDITITFPTGKWFGASPLTTCYASSTTILTVVVANGVYHYTSVPDLR
jgi:hypothetical protein